MKKKLQRRVKIKMQIRAKMKLTQAPQRNNKTLRSNQVHQAQMLVHTSLTQMEVDQYGKTF